MRRPSLRYARSGSTQADGTSQPFTVKRTGEGASFDIVIVGAGAAGLATAIFTRRLNPSRSVLLLDGAARPGAKILVSGGSRCNVTNTAVSERDFAGGRPTIVRRVLRAFSPADTVAWFASLGVPLHEEAHGKLFPDSNRSRDVLDALLREVHASGVVLRAGSRVNHLAHENGRFALGTARGPIDAGVVVMATGGLSLPKTGSDGGGLEIAQRLGHTIVPTTPALVPLICADQQLHEPLSGVAHDVDIAVWIDGAVAGRLHGALLWTHFGVSGPVVLDVSRHWLRARLDQRDARLTVNFAPGESFDSVDRTWTLLAEERPRASLQSALARMIPASVATAALQHVGLDAAATLADLSRTSRRRLTRALIEWPLSVTGSRGYNYAEATAGGVALDEIDPGTMASRRCPGLYLVGEMLDVDGRIGGFNFQWAWSSARAAARALAEL
jgi:predicted Rossmann fold flavoprotein